MSAQPKYRASPVYWDALNKIALSTAAMKNLRQSGALKESGRFSRFDSVLEFNVYLKLVDLVGAERILRQYPLEIIPPGYCYLTGKRWRVDFAIVNEAGDKFPANYVEAKGLVLPEFRFQLASLESYDPDAFDQLTIVFDRKIDEGQIFKRLMKTDFSSRVYTLKEFQCISNLK
jgi:hypothetical protein